MILYRIKGVRRLYLILENFLFNLVYKKRLGNKVTIFGWPIITWMKGSEIKVGNHVVFCSRSEFSEPGIHHEVIIRLLSENAKLTIGNDVGISGGGICVAEEVVIGNEVLLGANVFITDTDFHPLNPKNRRWSREGVSTRPIEIGDNVFIGMNSVVLKGTTIGKNSIIGAGSVVTGQVPPNQIWGGNPARFIKNLA